MAPTSFCCTADVGLCVGTADIEQAPCNCNHGIARARYSQQVRSCGPPDPEGRGLHSTLATSCGCEGRPSFRRSPPRTGGAVSHPLSDLVDHRSRPFGGHVAMQESRHRSELPVTALTLSSSLEELGLCAPACATREISRAMSSVPLSGVTSM
jgi:hypothetical protein